MPFNPHLPVFKITYEDGYQRGSDSVLQKGLNPQGVALPGVGLLPVYEQAEDSVNFAFRVSVNIGDYMVKESYKVMLYTDILLIPILRG